MPSILLLLVLSEVILNCSLPLAAAAVGLKVANIVVNMNMLRKVVEKRCFLLFSFLCLVPMKRNDCLMMAAMMMKSVAASAVRSVV